MAQKGHALIGGSASGSGFFRRAVIAFIGLTTKKKIAAATRMKLISALRKSP